MTHREVPAVLVGLLDRAGLRCIVGLALDWGRVVPRERMGVVRFRRMALELVWSVAGTDMTVAAGKFANRIRQTRRKLLCTQRHNRFLNQCLK